MASIKDMTPYQTIATIFSVVSVIILFLMGILYRLYEEFIYKYAFSIRNTINISELGGEMRVGRFGIFISTWILLLIFNMAICSIVFGKCDYVSQMKTTSILYVGIVATTFVLIGLIPSLVEIFENTFGLFVVTTRPMAWLFKYEEIMKVFQSKVFKDNKNIVIPFDSLLPLFNIHTFQETFDAIANDATAGAAMPDDGKEHYDFMFDYEKMCESDGSDGEKDAKRHFRDALFRLCFAKYNAGHFAWAYIATIVTILSVASVK
jgi:hypothetical protein